MAKWSRGQQAWYDAIRNCHNPKRKQYSQYGALGIQVCKEWKESYQQFLADMGAAPMDRTWLGRLDVKGNYEPANCIWTNREEQENRRAFCRKVTLQGRELTATQASRLPGQTLPIYEWARRLGIGQETLRKRIKAGWPVEIALSPELRRGSSPFSTPAPAR